MRLVPDAHLMLLNAGLCAHPEREREREGGRERVRGGREKREGGQEGRGGLIVIPSHFLTLLMASMLASLSSSRDTAHASPTRDATCKGVWPFLSAMFGSPPQSSRCCRDPLESLSMT